MPGGIHPPIEVILSWPPGNYLNPHTRPKVVLVLACILGPLSLLLLLARLWVRIKMQRSAGLDDWLMIAAIGPVIALTVIFPLATEYYGFNKHVWDVDPGIFVRQRKIVLTIEVLFCVTAGLIKISILLFFRRLSSRSVSPVFRVVCWVTIGFIAAYSIAFTLVPIFGCKPISAFWDQSDFIKQAQGYQYRCFNEGADVFAAGVISAVQDLATAMLPTFLYWNLQIPIRQKVALFGIFAIGYGVVAVGALRAWVSWVIFFETYDATWWGWANCLLAMLELHVGCICANAPALKVFAANFLKLERLTTRSKRSGDSHGGKKSSGGSGLSSMRNIFKPNRSHSSKGYLSEPHTHVSVDNDGTVKYSNKYIRKDVAITTNSVNITGNDSTDAIEMDNWDSRNADSRDNLEAGLQAQPPAPPAAARDDMTNNRDNNYPQANPGAPKWQHWS